MRLQWIFINVKLEKKRERKKKRRGRETKTEKRKKIIKVIIINRYHFRKNSYLPININQQSVQSADTSIRRISFHRTHKRREENKEGHLETSSIVRWIRP